MSFANKIVLAPWALKQLGAQVRTVANDATTVAGGKTLGKGGEA